MRHQKKLEIIMITCSNILKRHHLSDLPKSTLLKTHLLMCICQRHNESILLSVTYSAIDACEKTRTNLCVCVCFLRISMSHSQES